MGKTITEGPEREKEFPRRSVLNSTVAKIIAFFILAAGVCSGVTGVIGTAYLIDEDYYTDGFVQMAHDRMISDIWSDVQSMKQIYKQEDFEEEDIELFLLNTNLSVKAYLDDELLWDMAPDAQEDNPFHFVCYTTIRMVQPVGMEPEEGEQDGTEYPADYSTRADMDNGLTSDENTVGSPSSKMVLSNATATDRNDTGFSVEPAGNEWNEGVEASALTEIVEREMTFYLYVDPAFPAADKYSRIFTECRWISEFSDVLPVMAVAGCLLALFAFIFLMCSAGHHRGKEGISESVLSFLHFDILTILFGITALIILVPFMELISYRSNLQMIILINLLVAVESVWGTVYLREFALRLKMRTLLKTTLIAAILRWILKVYVKLPLVLNTAIIFAGISILEMIGILLFANTEVFILWLLEKAVLFPIVLYCAQMCKLLQKGSEALAEGDLNYQIDTSFMLFDLKQHGENLNSIAQGMTVAVEQRMKSEHLRTELITNVSHDLKTPLTSIINYANLIGSLVAELSGQETIQNDEILKIGGVVSEVSEHVEGETAETGRITAAERERLSEYAEVLLRQSKRLKKLLDDLVEASKATTGNLEVHLQPCQVGVLLTQAVGEYEQRFQEKGLELITRQPEEDVTVMADGRHIWRVFDNLLNNICKYAQENSRVYLTVEVKQEQAEIIFRNMSKYPMDVQGEELMERFVRGDKSRHMEGNGLGLSIASSLVELQKGRMEVVTDGDLFKVIIQFPV